MYTMNRCLTPRPGITPARLLFGLALGVAAALPLTASAQNMVRQFPAAALRGTLEVTAPPNVLLNGQAARLSPGARIKNTNNALVMSASLVGNRLVVNYLRDHQGLVHEVWLLSPAEAQEKRAGLGTAFNFSFGSDVQRPKLDDGNTPFEPLPKFSPQ
jgi:hypothetical protein